MFHGTTFGHAGPTPEFVMRTGAYALLDPMNARQGVSPKFVNTWTAEAVGRQPALTTARTYPPPVATGPILPPQPAAPIAEMPAAPAVAAAMKGGFFGYGFGADAPVPVVVAPAMPTKTWALVAGLSGLLGILGGTIAGGPGRRAFGGVTGAVTGLASGVGAVLLARR